MNALLDDSEVIKGTIAVGDAFTIAAVHPVIPNHARRWWQIWKPRMVADKTRLVEYIVIGKAR